MEITNSQGQKVKFESVQKLEDYKNKHWLLSRGRSSKESPNFDSVHATIVLKYMLDICRYEVIIYDNDLSGDLSGMKINKEENEKDFTEYNKYVEFSNKRREKLLNAFKNHLKNGGDLIIIVRDGSVKKSHTYEKLKSLSKIYSNNLFVYEASTKFKEKIKAFYGVDINLAVGDNFAYRIEPKREDLPPENRKARVCYSGEAKAKDYKKLLKNNLDSCKALEFE